MPSVIDMFSRQTNFMFDVKTSEKRKLVIRMLEIFFRKLHQHFEYCDRNHDEFFAHVHLVLGGECAYFLSLSLGMRRNFDSPSPVAQSRLRRSLEKLYCNEKYDFLDFVNFPRLIKWFLQTLYEETQHPKPMPANDAVHMVFWALGDEIAFHLSSLFPGRNFRSALEELDFLEDREEDFILMVENWAIKKAKHPVIQYDAT